MGLQVDLERQLNDWLLDFTKASGDDFIPYKEVEISAYRSFEERLGDLAQVFPKVFEFVSFLAATSHMYVWVSLINLHNRSRTWPASILSRYRGR